MAGSRARLGQETEQRKWQTSGITTAATAGRGSWKTSRNLSRSLSGQDGSADAYGYVAVIDQREDGTLLSDCVIGDNSGFEYSDPPLIHQPCGAVLCTVEPGDNIESFAAVARDHECGDGRHPREAPPMTYERHEYAPDFSVIGHPCKECGFTSTNPVHNRI